MDPEMEARLEACESIIIALMTVMPEMEFAFFKQSFINQKHADDRPLKPAPSSSLKHVVGYVEEAEKARIQLALNSHKPLS